MAQQRGYSSYGNQIGLATGIVSELYHPGYAAKHMELGAVLGAAPERNVRRERPAPGDAVVLLGGRTGRDGCGGATGSSKAHSVQSLSTCGAEVQKGNAPEERKLQRLFRNPEASRLIKRCNDFGAGGVSVAVGELAAGLLVDLDAVPRKYEGLTATEIAISESQERMAVGARTRRYRGVPAPCRGRKFGGHGHCARRRIAPPSDALVREHGCGYLPRVSGFQRRAKIGPQHMSQAPRLEPMRPWMKGEGRERLLALVSNLNICSQRGLCERFDSTIGAATVLLPLRRRTPAHARAGDGGEASRAGRGYDDMLGHGLWV